VTGGFGRRSDRAFISALAEAGLVDLETLNDRVGCLPSTVAPEVRKAAHAIVHSLGQGNR
ncbi:MAG: hypothetical protein ABR500_09435, partial [Dermatophilaceae bacterium]